ncbi:MAG: O-antigen ligase domain-containing protein [Xanthobacteraceae bacterium]|nr:MAG: O-antigen ligase domain-containing protein [Xanthobacteraceae bacterium]
MAPVAAPAPLAPAAASGLAALQRSLMWLIGAGGAIVFIEPSPYEIATLMAIALFAVTGLRMRPMVLPLIVLLALINIGYSIAAAHLLDDTKIINWILTSWYMAITAVFFAMAFADDTTARLDFLCRGYVVGAVIAALAGIAGYFHLVPGGDDLLTLYSRARGTFKDPNVLGAFLILPALIALQRVVVADSLGRALRGALVLGIIALAILLSFSRAAWGQLVITAAVMLTLMFLTSPSHAQRARIVLIAAVAVAFAALLVAVILSLDSVAGLFKERASFDQSYDTGRFGRFGRHALGFAMALDLPLGIGPLQFSKYFPEDTHNSYLNAFMSGGWLAGIAYPALVATTVLFSLRNALARVPWQRGYLALLAAFLGTVGESFIIDTDHWRHYFLMLGVMWGLVAATREWQARQGRQ